MAPGKPASSDNFIVNFPSCSESAEICHVDSFCVEKMSLCFFFSSKAEKYGQNWAKIPPSLSVSKQCRIPIVGGQTTVHVCCILLEEGGWGGWTFKNIFLSPLVEKNTPGTFFAQKKSQHGKFQQILSNLESRHECVTLGLASMDPSNLI